MHANTRSQPLKLALASAVVAFALSGCGEPVPPNDSVAQRPDSPARSMPSERPMTAPTQPQTVQPQTSPPGEDTTKREAPKQ